MLTNMTIDVPLAGLCFKLVLFVLVGNFALVLFLTSFCNGLIHPIFLLLSYLSFDSKIVDLFHFLGFNW